MSTQTISKWGSSLGLRLPAAFAKQMQLAEGAEVELVIDGKRLVIERVEPKANARQFFADVKASQETHGLVKMGKSRGKELR
jgi:antitoxin MazE